MTRYVAFLRGVSPMNAKMSEIRRAFERAGFTDVKTVLSSGNVVFSARSASEAALERTIDASVQRHLGRTFPAIVRSRDVLRRMLATDPYASFQLKVGSKRIVTFLRGKTTGRPRLPMDGDGARILCRRGGHVFSAYVPSPRGPVFMALIENAFGKSVTTRTWETVRKVAR